MDKNGKAKKNAKGYNQQKFWPRQFVGYRAGAESGSKSNGASDELRAEATAAVVAALNAAEGRTLTRASLVRALSNNPSPNSNSIIQLVIKDEFHNNQPWVRTGSTYQLPA